MTNTLSEACQRVGIIPRQVPNDGRWHQTDAEGKHAKNGNGRIKMFSDGNGGMVHNWVTMIEPELFFFNSDVKLSADDLAEQKNRIERERAKAAKELAEERAKAAETAAELWKQAKPVVSHDYLTRKQVKPIVTIKQMDIGAIAKIIGYTPQAKGQRLEGAILIAPIADDSGICSVEMIDATGRKAALAGGQKAGCFWMTGKPLEGADLFVIGEGVATVLTVSEAMQCTGVAALSCHNLKAVTGHIRSKYPTAKVVVLSDIGNGEQSATSAAALHGCYLAKPVLPEGSTGTDFNDVHVESGLDEVRRQIESALNDSPLIVRKPLFTSFHDMMTETIVIKKMIGGIIPAGCTCQLFGPSGDGKTFIALDMALSVATGGIWNGHQCEQGLVVYFNGEGREGFKRRCKAWQQHHGITGRVDFHSSRSSITFDTAGLSQATAEIKELEAQTGRKVALIVIDTLARHLIGDENSTKDMSEFVRSVDSTRNDFPDSSALVVHHTGNNTEVNGRSRGSSALKAALDVELQCMRGTLSFTKVKDAEAPTPIDFKLKVVELGTDDAGEPITSCVVQYGEKSAKNKSSAIPSTPTEKDLFKIVTDYPGILCGDLRVKYCERRRAHFPEAKTHTLTTAYRRAYQSLIEKEIFAENCNEVYIKDSMPSHVTKSSQTSFCDGGETVTTVTPPLRGVMCDAPCDVPADTSDIQDFDV